MQENLPKFSIETIAPHPWPHIDEVLADVLGKRYGSHIFLGIEDAPLLLESFSISEEEALLRGILPLGQCRGRFDDKMPGSGSRKPDTCCSLEMARFLSVENRPELQPILRAVKRVDSTPQAAPYDISALMKCAVSFLPESAHPAVFNWAGSAISAIIDYYESGKSKVTDYVRPTTVLEQMVTDEMIQDKGVIEKTRHLCCSAEKQDGNCLSMAFVSMAMKVVGISDEDAFEWLCFGLANYAKQQEEYQTALVEVQAGFSFHLSANGGPRKGVLVHSDNSEVAKASRSKGLDFSVCIVRKIDGCVSILSNQQQVSVDEMRATVAIIRLLETSPNKQRRAIFDDYCRDGSHEVSPIWHIANGGAILNRETATQLNDKQIVEAVIHGLRDGQQHFDEIVRKAEKMTEGTVMSNRIPRGSVAVAELEIALG